MYVSAAEAVPNAVRPHLSLARDWFTLDPHFLQGERAIREAEAAEKIVAGTADRDIPSVIPATLARLCLARGDLVASRTDDASAKWYREALQAGLQAVAADRAFDANHRRREMARGRPSDEIPPDGNPEVYATLGRVYNRPNWKSTGASSNANTSLTLNYRTATVTLDWLLDPAVPTKITIGTVLPVWRPRGSGTLICIKPAISPGAGPAYCNCAVERSI